MHARPQNEIARLERFVERFRAKATKARQAQSRLKAMERMEKALQAGGNRVESNADTPAQRPISIPHALELLRVRRPDAVRPHLDVLLSQLLPLLALMDETLTLGLPMDVIQRRAADTAGKK